MSEAAILAAVEGVNNRLDDLNKNVAAYRKEGQRTNEALWKGINDGKKCQTKIKLDHQELKGDVRALRNACDRMAEDMRTVVGSLRKHIQSKTEHFNQAIKDEGVLGYAWRTRVKIAIQTTVVTLITVGGGLLIKWLQSIQIGG